MDMLSTDVYRAEDTHTVLIIPSLLLRSAAWTVEFMAEMKEKGQNVCVTMPSMPIGAPKYPCLLQSHLTCVHPGVKTFVEWAS